MFRAWWQVVSVANANISLQRTNWENINYSRYRWFRNLVLTPALVVGSHEILVFFSNICITNVSTPFQGPASVCTRKFVVVLLARVIGRKLKFRMSDNKCQTAYSFWNVIISAIHLGWSQKYSVLLGSAITEDLLNSYPPSYWIYWAGAPQTNVLANAKALSAKLDEEDR